jgi:hypothetical protein
MENWKHIPGFEEKYAVSDLGNVASLRFDRLLLPGLFGEYLWVSLSEDGTPIRSAIHRIVLITFKGFDFRRQFGNHINGIKIDNRLENLEWMTTSENLVHSTMVLGNNLNQKLSRGQVSEIKSLFGSISQAEISRRYGVSQMTISKIASGKLWKTI